MDFLGNIPLLVLLLMTGAGAILVKDLIGAVLILGSYSFFLALAWAWLGAVDVAFTEAVVGAGLSTVFFLLTLFHTTPEELTGREARPPWQALVGLGLLGSLLLYGATDLPALGDPMSPPNAHISPAYIERSVADAQTPNMVTAVLMDYRALDTLIETAVIFTAGVVCALLLRRDHA